MKAFWQDLRYGARILLKQPGFTLIVVLTLALGIGVNAAILSAVHGFVLRPLAIEKPSDVVVSWWGKKQDAQVWGDFSYANFEDLRAQNQSFASLCAWANVSVGISAGESRSAADSERAEVIWGELVSGNYFDVIGVKPILGRGFTPEEDRTPNTHPVVVIGHQLWQRRFKADPNVLGQTIYLNGSPFTIIGVAPESLLGSTYYLRNAFWVPTMMSQKLGHRANWKTDRSYAAFRLYGRLQPGVTMAQAETDMNRVASSLAQLYPRENSDTRIQLRTELDGRYNDATQIIKYGGVLALCVSALVLLIACANVANLLLARAVTRAREIGIRLALGAGRWRIVRQLLTESMMLAVLGGALGLLFAAWGAPLIAATRPPVPYPLNLDFAPDGTVLRWTIFMTLATAVIFGLAPALLASRADLVAVMKGEATAPTRRRRWNLRGALVVAQVTISLVVLICAGLFMRSLSQAAKTDPGFQAENLVTMMIDPKTVGYDAADATRRLFPELLRRLQAQPGVRRAALVNEMPLMVEQLTRGPIVKEGEIDPPPNQGTDVECSLVTPYYFDTLRTPLVSGRDFNDRDTAEATPVVIVNQEFARRFYGSEPAALGKRFRFAQGTPLMEIIGIAQNGRYRTLYEDPRPYLFLPLYQHPRQFITLAVSAQSAAALPSVVESARQTIAQMDSRLPVMGVMTAAENLSLAYWGPRVAAGMASSFGVLALLLATMGLYSVMSYAVSTRTREIGIRMALGADLRDVLLLIVRQGMRWVVIGLALGLLGAFALTRMLGSLLLGVSTSDPLTFWGVALVLAAVALVACWMPARRATKVDPMIALRCE